MLSHCHDGDGAQKAATMNDRGKMSDSDSEGKARGEFEASRSESSCGKTWGKGSGKIKITGKFSFDNLVGMVLVPFLSYLNESYNP